MSMMKAAFIHTTGNPNVIEWGQLPVPIIASTDVLVKVSFVAANPVDTYIRSGKYRPHGSAFPIILGHDVVGTVEKVGSDVKGFKVGDRVWSCALGMQGRQGTFSEYVAVNENLLFHSPDNVDDQSIVTVIQAGVTASLGLVRVAMLKAGEVIFVNGGSGNVGAAVIQLAKARGARVIALTSDPEKMEWCKQLGAELVLDRHMNVEEEVKKIAPQGVDVYWETSKGPNFDLAVNLLAKRGRLVLMAGSGSKPPFPVGPFYLKECVMKGFTILEATPVEFSQCAELVNLCLKRGALRGRVAEVLPVSEAAKAHELLENKKDLWGKVVLKM